VDIDDGSLLVLYTDGLVERRTEDIDVGLAKLRAIFGPGSADRPLEDLCKATLAGVYADQQRDDIALLIARLRRISEDNFVSWRLPAELTSAHRARTLIRRPMKRWGLTELIPAAELLASELVHQRRPVRAGPDRAAPHPGGGLVIEVLDDSAALPRLRHPDDDEERGRGLQVVSQSPSAGAPGARSRARLSGASWPSRTAEVLLRAGALAGCGEPASAERAGLSRLRWRSRGRTASAR